MISVAGFDEDVITMGIEAAETVIESAKADVAKIDLLIMGTCSSPYGEHSAAAEVSRALGLERTAMMIDLAGSTLCGVTAIQVAHDSIKAGRAKQALVVISERRRGAAGSNVEALGSGAIAVLVGETQKSEIDSLASYRYGVPTRWRTDGSLVLQNYDDARYELGMIEVATSKVFSEFNSKNPVRLAVGPVDVKSQQSLRKSAGLSNQESSFDFSSTGDLGSAGTFFELAALLQESVGSTIACIGVESGTGAFGFTLSVSEEIPYLAHHPEAQTISYVEFLQRFGVLEGPTPPTPIVPYAATPGAARSDVEGSLTGYRCLSCSSLNIPARRSCIDCSGRDFAQERLTRFGQIVTFNLQHVVAVHPEPSPIAVGVVSLKGEQHTRGGRISAMFCDSDVTSLHINQEVELVYRRIGLDSGLVKYGWKFRTVKSQPSESNSNLENGTQ